MGSIPRQSHCVKFLDKELHSHGAYLSTEVCKWVPVNLIYWCSPTKD